MRTTILKLILVLGRYAVLPAVAVALVVFAAWLIALDHYQRLALVISPVVLPFTTSAVFLASARPHELLQGSILSRSWSDLPLSESDPKSGTRRAATE